MPKDLTGSKKPKKRSAASKVSDEKTSSSEDKMRLMDEMVMAFIAR
jgi:hypothetical protein